MLLQHAFPLFTLTRLSSTLFTQCIRCLCTEVSSKGVTKNEEKQKEKRKPWENKGKKEWNPDSLIMKRVEDDTPYTDSMLICVRVVVDGAVYCL